MKRLLSCCLTSTEAGWPIRDGDRVGRGQGDWLDRGNRPKKTGETVDRRQNNGSVKAVSPRHCPATCALRNCSFNCCAGQSLRQCPLHRCWWTTWTTRSKRRPTWSAQLHLPTHDLFWKRLHSEIPYISQPLSTSNHIPPPPPPQYPLQPSFDRQNTWNCCQTLNPHTRPTTYKTIGQPTKPLCTTTL